MTPGQRTARLAEIEAELPEWERAETIARSDEKALRDLISDVTAEMRSLTSTAHGIVWPRRYDDAPPEWSYAGIRQIQPYIARIDELRRSVAAESIGAREARERAEDAARIVAALKSQRQSIVKEAYRDR